MRRVAVTGLGVVSPVGNDIPTFWDSLTNGVCGIDYITKFDTADFKAKFAAEVKDFDPLKYIEKKELRKLDPYSQYALVAAGQAVEDSGIIGTVDPERLGVYIGAGIGGLKTLETEIIKLHEHGPRKVSPHFIPMMIGNIAAGNVAIKYNAQGPCVPVVTACSTGSNSIGEAFHVIAHGYADAMIAGGSEAVILPTAVAGFINCMALYTGDDKDAASIPFDKRRSGFVMGEGSGILILEEYEHAKARGAKIYAEIAGYGSTCDAYHVTAPHPEARGGSRAIKLAIEEAGIDSSSPMYINAHGTSTPLNDTSETKAIKIALGEENAKKAYISSTKSMTGHMLGAAGAVEAIASVKAIETGIIPPTIGYKEPDPECDLNYCPNKAVEAPVDSAVSISLGFGGHNAVLAFKKAKD